MLLSSFAKGCPKVEELGLKKLHENDNNVRRYMRCCRLSSGEDVFEDFELLVETMLTVDHLNELTTFFEHTCIHGRRQRGCVEVYGPAMFPIDTWNKHTDAVDGIARTMNSVEGWHHGVFQSIFQCQHPTLSTFFEGIQRNMQRQKTVFLPGVSGFGASKQETLSFIGDSFKPCCYGLWPF